MINAAIFDMDGTVLDSMPVWHNCSQIFLNEYGVTVTKEDIEYIEAKTQLQALSYFAEKYKQIGKKGDELMEAFSELIMYRYKTIATPKAGIIDFLEGFKRKNISMCIATLTDKSHSIEILKHKGLYKYFDFVITAADVGKSKRSPDVYLEACRKMRSTPSECIVFEDAPYAAQTAKNAGFTVCGIKEKAYSKTEGILLKSSDFVVCESFDEVKHIYE